MQILLWHKQISFHLLRFAMLDAILHRTALKQRHTHTHTHTAKAGVPAKQKVSHLLFVQCFEAALVQALHLFWGDGDVHIPGLARPASHHINPN